MNRTDAKHYLHTSHIVIPARLASTRLPRKLLLAETGKPLICHTYEAAMKARRPAGVCVAADSAEIVSVVEASGGRAILTDPAAASGTDRVAEAAQQLSEADIIVNVQGDEPDLSGESIDLVIRLLEENPQAVMSTLATPIRNRRQLEDPACVKVVFDANHRAMYFSRSAIPHAREWSDELLSRPAVSESGPRPKSTASRSLSKSASTTSQPPHFYQHVGLYAYRRDFLLRISQLPECELEKIEKLEQLRVLHAGYTIVVGVVDEPTFGIDTPEDYRAFVERRLTD